MPNTGAIKAYHGSPHSFDRFDISKIGTGEGAQAYGHGLYFADNEKVAKAYRDQLASGTMRTPSGALFDPTNELSHMNVRVAARKGGVDAAIARANEILASKDMPEATLAMARKDLDLLSNLKARGGAEPNPGHMYEVRINAEPEHFLDWDRPLSEQSPTVREAIERAGLPTTQESKWFGPEKPAGWDFPKWSNSGAYVRQFGPDEFHYGIGSPWDAEKSSFGSARSLEEAQRLIEQQMQPRSFTGQQLMTKLKQDTVGYGPDFGVEASEKLRQAGIPGIKYLDQGSRGAGEGSRNYVVFDDKLVDIMRKYGFVPFGAGVGMGYGEQGNQK
jgi:hypothetical protein